MLYRPSQASIINPSLQGKHTQLPVVISDKMNKEILHKDVETFVKVAMSCTCIYNEYILMFVPRSCVVHMSDCKLVISSMDYTVLLFATSVKLHLLHECTCVTFGGIIEGAECALTGLETTECRWTNFNKLAW